MIKSFSVNNDNIKAYKKYLESGEVVIEIRAQKAGETILQVEDQEGNLATTRIIIGGTTDTDSEDDTDSGDGDTGTGSGDDTGSGSEDAEIIELEKELNDLFKELGLDGIETNSANDYNTGCTINNQQKCLDEASKEAQKALKIKFVERILPLSENMLNKLFQKYGNEKMKTLANSIEKKYKNTIGKKKLVVETIITGINLRLSDQAYIDGVQDTLALNNLYDIALNVGAGVGISNIGKKVVEKLINKYPGKVATTLSSKFVPFIGWGLSGYAVATAGTENINYALYCNGNTVIDGKDPSYYCGVLTVNGILIGGGIGVSHLKPFGWFSKVAFTNIIKFDDIKLQKKYNSHGEDFGFLDNYNTTNRNLFKQVLIKHTNHTDTEMISGTFRTTIVAKHFYNKNTGLFISYDLDGNYLSGWKLSPSQLNYLLINGNIQ